MRDLHTVPKMVVDCAKARSGIEVASLTDVGLQRANNEDSYLYWEPEDGSLFPQKGRLGVIADGMGGYEGGQEASRIAVHTVRDIYANSRTPDPKAALYDAFTLAHGDDVSISIAGIGTLRNPIA